MLPSTANYRECMVYSQHSQPYSGGCSSDGCSLRLSVPRQYEQVAVFPVWLIFAESNVMPRTWWNFNGVPGNGHCAKKPRLMLAIWCCHVVSTFGYMPQETNRQTPNWRFTFTAGCSKFKASIWCAYLPITDILAAEDWLKPLSHCMLHKESEQF